MINPIRIGIIGLDTSHVTAFSELLENDSHRYHVPGAKVTAAFPGGSPDWELSYSRVDRFTEELRQKYGVTIVDSPKQAAERCDAIMLESVDGRVHLEQFKEIIAYGLPVFVDKPFALQSDHAREMIDLAEKHNVPLMSSSALRYAEALVTALADQEQGTVIGCDTFGPMALQPTQPGLFWYGIHAVEMLFAVLGKDCVQVTATTNKEHELVVGEWKDGRIGTARGNRRGNSTFGAVIHRDKGSRYVDVKAFEKPYYAGLLERIMAMFKGGAAPIDLNETLSVIRFIEAANESRETGKTVIL